MEKGIFESWTPGLEIQFEERLKHCRTFAERHLVLTIRDMLKYDARTKEARRAVAQARLRIAVATDKDLEELAELEAAMKEDKTGGIPGLYKATLAAESLKKFKSARAKTKEKGISSSDLCKC